jgi:hypothetical protein
MNPINIIGGNSDIKETLEGIIRSLGYEIKKAFNEPDGFPFVNIGEGKHISWHNWGGSPLCQRGKTLETFEVFGLPSSNNGYGNALCLSEVECLRIVIGELMLIKELEK